MSDDILLAWRHLETVARILEAVAAVEVETDQSIVACEDALVALHVGLQLQLSPTRIAAMHRRTVAESRAKHENARENAASSPSERIDPT